MYVGELYLMGIEGEKDWMNEEWIRGWCRMEWDGMFGWRWNSS